ncbi:hypothetical protein HWV62_32293 [Athelia sp. TMB]|nr:hypothetical protein HWV62_32293 [Athelia sp. TMB]
MSFSFEWPRFSEQFHTDAIQMLNTALNKGNKPPVIADRIEVVELEMGSEPPELEIRDIGDLTVDQFRGIFRFTYAGDAHIVLKTKVQVSSYICASLPYFRANIRTHVQANPLNHKQPDIHLMSGSRGMLAAKQPLVVPMLLRLSHFKLNSYVVLVVSKQKGITLVFKTDPLQNVDINSSFDSIAVIQKFIQKEIEGQLRQMFREDLPGIIHRLSQQWVKAKVEAPYLNKAAPSSPRRQVFDNMSAPDLSGGPISSNVGLHQHLLRQHSLGPGPLSYGRGPSSSSGRSVSIASSGGKHRLRPKISPLVPEEAAPTSFPDLENFDPTYGLRPEGVPAKSVFTSFGQLFSPNKGLADLAEESDGPEGEYGYEESGSFDVVDWDDTVPDYSPPPSVSSLGQQDEFETRPAVGGGTITRPRIYHSQSMIQSPVESPGSPIHQFPFPNNLAQQFGARGRTQSSISATSMMESLYGPNLARPRSMFEVPTTSTPPLHPGTTRHEGARTQPHSRSNSGLRLAVATPPSPLRSSDDSEGQGIYIRRPRANSGAFSTSTSAHDPFASGSPPNGHEIHEPNPQIVLRPSLNNSIHQLSTLSHSNHTLSPYTRSLSHFTVRSVPPRDPGALNGIDRQPVKAKRKRIYRMGGKTAPALPSPTSPAPIESVKPPSEFDASDMDRYFRADGIPGSPDLSSIESPRQARPHLQASFRHAEFA